MGHILVLLFATVFTVNAKSQNLVGYIFSKDNKNKTPFELVLSTFSTDGCTHYEDGPKENPTLWQHCCLQHDIAYWLGGTESERKTADDNLFMCVKDTGHPGEARIMYLGTRAGGGPLRHTTYRWGFGWNRVRDYKKLSGLELNMAYDMYGEDLVNLKKDAAEKKFPINVPPNYDFVSNFPYSFCEEEIINHLSPKLARTATVTKYNEYEVAKSYNIRIGLDICDESIEYKFTKETDATTCKKDYAAYGRVNKIDNVKISKDCLRRIREI